MKIPKWLRWRSNAELDEEIETHLDMEVRANLDRGLPPDEARAAAKRRFGNPLMVKERAREGDLLFRLEGFFRDIRHAFRNLARSPGFTITAVFTLALAIGADTAIFSVVDGVLIRPLPYPDADSLVRVAARTLPQANITGGEVPFSDVGYWHFFNNNRAFEHFGAFRAYALPGEPDPWALTTADGSAISVGFARMTASAFAAVTVQPQIGRWPTPEEDAPDGPRVALLSHRLWSEAFGSDPSVIGRAVELNGIDWEVIGVMPRGYDFPSPETDVWIPMQLNPRNRNSVLHGFDGIARLAPGATIESARADARRLISGFSEAGYAASYMTGYFSGDASIRTLKDDIVGDSSRAVLILLGTMGFVLLIACSNVANLFQVRAESRTLDAAVRVALGSGRRRLIRYALTEGIFLGLLGGVAGILLAYAGIRALVAIRPSSIPRLDEIGINGTVLGFTALVSIAAGLLFAMLPALRTSSPSALVLLQGSGRNGPIGRTRHRTRIVLAVTQVALALALFVASALMVRSFAALYSVDPGFHAEGVLTFRVAPSPRRYQGAAAVAAFYDEFIDSLRALPGVSDAGAITFLPMTGGLGADSDLFLTAQIEEFPTAPGGFPPSFLFRRAAQGYFEAMRIRLVEGRTFEPGDHNFNQLGAMIISQSIKKEYWPNESALGKRITIAGRPATVVGVVGDVHDAGLSDPAEKIAYKPMFDSSGRGVLGMDVIVRTGLDPLRVAPEVQRVVRTLDATVPVANIRSMQSIVGASLSRTTFTMTILGLAAVIALLIGGVGVYGVISYSVSQRRGEIGLRQALGADRSSVRRLILREGVVICGTGIVLGIATAAGLGRVLSSLLYEVSPYDALTLIGGSVVLIGVVALASAIPAVRAARISPAAALRGD